MRLLIRAVLRQLLVQRGTTVSVFCGIALAMASIVAVHLLADLVQRELQRASAGGWLGLTHLLHREGLTEGDYFELRGRWRTGALDGVTALLPLVEGRVVAVTRRGELDLRLLGLDPLAMGTGRAQGAVRLTPDHSWFDGTRAWIVGAHAGLEPGARIEVGAGAYPVEIAGVLDVPIGVGEPLLVVDIGMAQRVLGVGDGISRIGVSLRERADRVSVWLERLFPGLGAQRYVTEEPWRLAPYHVEALRDRGERLFAGAVLFNLSALSMLSAVVAGFLVHQGAINSIRQRERVFDRLRAMGATDGWLAVHVILEGLVAALVGAAVGCVVGWLGAQALARSTFGAAELTTELGADGVLGWAFGKALVAGPLVGGGAMWLAFRHVYRPSKRAAVALTAATLAAAALGHLLGGVVGVFVIIAAAALLGASITGPTLRAWAWLLARRRVLQRLNGRSLGYARSDVSVALGGLTIALAAALAMSLMVTSFRGAFVRMLDQRLDAQLYLDAQVGFADADLEALRAAAGSGATLRLERRDIARVAEGNRGIDVEVIHDRGPDAAHRYGHEGELSRDAALVSEPGAQRYGWSAGDTLTLAGDGPPRRVTVAGVFRDYGSPRPRVVVSAEVGDSLFRDAPVRAVAVGNVDGQSRAAVESLAHRSGWRVRRDDEVRTRALDVFARSFRVSDALVVVAVSVAVVGLFNALFAVRLRRQSELRLLAAMGLSRGEQLRMNATYAAMLGVHAIVVALPVGLGIGWLLCRVLNPRAFGWSIPFAADVDAIVTVLGLGLLGATLAGLSTGPGLRLERVDAP